MKLIAKLKTLAASTGLYICYLLGACVLTMLVEAMLVFFIDHIVLLSYPVLTIIRIVIYSVGVPAIIGVLGYYEGYREAECSVGETTGAFFLALIVHILFAMLFKFQGFISGAVRFTAGLIHNKWNITQQTLVENTPYSLFLIVFLAYSIFYFAVLFLCKYFGSKKRICDRAELRRNETEA